MTTNKPYKIYISWDGTYTNGVFSGSFTDITDDIFDNNLIVSRQRDDYSLAIVRNFLTGDFTITGNSYNNLLTAINLGYPELILKVLKWQYDVNYFEVVKVAVETRPSEMDNNRKYAKLSKFKTIDDYTDILASKIDEKITHEFQGYTYNQGAYYYDSGVKVYERYASMLYTSPITNSFNYVDFDLNSGRKYGAFFWGILPGYRYSSLYYNFGSSSTSSGTEPIGLYLGCPTNPRNITLTLRDLLKLYKTMFNLNWYIYEMYVGQLAIMFRFPKDIFNSNETDFTDESIDFQKYKYIYSNYNKLEYFTVSDNNLINEHQNQPFNYDVANDITSNEGNEKIVTDFEYSTNPTGTEWTKGDWYIFLGKTDATPNQIEIESGAGTLNPLNTVINYKCSQSYRMENYLNDFRQLDSAFYNLHTHGLNPNIKAFEIEQEPFYVNIDNFSYFDMNQKILTSLGTMYVKELSYNLKLNAISIICVK